MAFSFYIVFLFPLASMAAANTNVNEVVCKAYDHDDTKGQYRPNYCRECLGKAPALVKTPKGAATALLQCSLDSAQNIRNVAAGYNKYKCKKPLAVAYESLTSAMAAFKKGDLAGTKAAMATCREDGWGACANQYANFPGFQPEPFISGLGRIRITTEATSNMLGKL